MNYDDFKKALEYLAPEDGEGFLLDIYLEQWGWWRHVALSPKPFGLVISMDDGKLATVFPYSAVLAVRVSG